WAPMPARTLAQKLWDSHVVRTGAAGDEPDLLYVDLHLVHEVTSAQAFEGLRMTGRHVRRPDLTVATMDHNVPTRGGVRAADELSRKQMEVLAENCEREGIPLHKIGSRRQGIVHIIGPELGLSKPGMVAPDDTTFKYMERRPYAPRGSAWEAALDYWRSLPTDPDATFDHEIELDAAQLSPFVTWGTNPGQVVPITGRVPAPRSDT